MSRLLLVRHGQSAWNEAGRWQGQADPPLTELGRHQAKAAAAAVGAVDVVATSTLQRARDTAEMLAEELGVGPVLELTGMIERDVGEWSGLTRSEIDERFPGYLADGRRPPGWESDESVASRTLGTLQALVTRYADADILCVTHGGVVMQLEGLLGGERHRLANLGGRWLEVSGDEFHLGPRVDLLDGIDVTVPDQL